LIDGQAAPAGAAGYSPFTPTGSGRPDQTKGEIMSPDNAAQLAALVELSVAYWGARDLTWGVLWRAFGDPLPPLSECIWPPPGISEVDAQIRLQPIRHFLQGTTHICRCVRRDIRKAQEGLVASGFDPPDSWIIANPLEDFKGGEMGLCGAREIVQSAPAEYAAFDKVWKEIDLALIRLRGKIASPTPPAAPRKPRKRTRKADPKAAQKQNERKKRQEIEKTIRDEWEREDWGGRYQDYVEWKNQHLPKGWPELTHRMVERAVENVKRRERDKK
jgi:hypothetical protein